MGRHCKSEVDSRALAEEVAEAAGTRLGLSLVPPSPWSFLESLRRLAMLDSAIAVVMSGQQRKETCISDFCCLSDSGTTSTSALGGVNSTYDSLVCMVMAPLSITGRSEIVTLVVRE